MKRIKLYAVLFIAIISSFFVIQDIYGIFVDVTIPNVNSISVSQNTSYTVVHEIMNLDGSTYTEHSRSNHNATIGTTVTPPVLTLEGFDSPSTVSVTLDSFTNTVITYRYTRKQYTLTINNSSYVTTTTPSGTYYYGQVIHLVADTVDSGNNPFVRWSNNETNRDYTFTLTGDVTIEPIYGLSYTVTYEPENGDSPIVTYVPQNQQLGSLPSVSYDDCASGTGDYHTRQCTYVFEFEGWYSEPTWVNQIYENYIPTSDITLYAKWNKIYYSYDGQYVCDGTNYINTGIKMFNQKNADKDFIIKFTVEQNNGFHQTYANDTNDNRGSIFTNMYEVGEPYPGVQFFTYNNTAYTMNINTLGNKQKKADTGYVTGQSVEIKKENGIVYYIYDGGTPVRINDFSNFSTYFDNYATFCAGTSKQGYIFRYFVGTISDMSVEILEKPSYTLHFDANGGSGVMADQIIELGETTNINLNEFTHADASFGGWNTAADGTGTSYSNHYAITSDLGNNGDVITLYAQWIPIEHFYVHFDANGGTGSMNDQEFTISAPAVPLTANSFTRTNYEFRGWNTAADGSGTYYEDEEAVRDLSVIDDDVVTLYAQWWKIEYNHPGDAVFNGTSTTFIDTGVNVFSSTNINKDFEIRFRFITIDSDIFTVSPTQPTMFNVKDESNNKYPGFNIRFNNNVNVMNSTWRWGGNTQNVPSNGIRITTTPIDFVYKRTNKVVTMQYSYSGFTSEVYTLMNQTSWNLNQPFATNVAFGGYFDSSNTPGRFFKGTLSDMIILIAE